MSLYEGQNEIFRNNTKVSIDDHRMQGKWLIICHINV